MGGGDEPVEGRRLDRIVVVGNGASGKTTFARELGTATGITPIELDAVFWSADLTAMPVAEWRTRQAEIVAAPRWILDGDLGPYDALDVRLRDADAVVLFDLPTLVCAWRAFRRSRQRLDFWKWLFTWRRTCRPVILRAIGEFAPDARCCVIRTTRQRAAALSELTVRMT